MFRGFPRAPNVLRLPALEVNMRAIATLMIIYIICSTAHAQPTANLGASQSMQNTQSMQKESKRNKEVTAERGRASTRSRSRSRRAESSRSKTRSFDFSRRRSLNNRESVELNINPGSLVVAAIQRIEAGEGAGPVADAIRSAPAFSKPCQLRARV